MASGQAHSSARRKRRAIQAGVIPALLEILDVHVANASIAHDCLVALGTIYSIECRYHHVTV